MAAGPDIAQRDVFGSTMVELGEADGRVLVLDGDLATSTRADRFASAYPERFLQMGIAEQNMVGVAAGLAAMGFVPFISTFAAFAVCRALDQLRVLVAQPRSNVKIAAGYAGLLTGMTGQTHQSFDDLAVMRAMPGMVVLAPADDVEARQVLLASAAHAGPVYIRLARDPVSRVFDESYRFALGKAVVLRRGGSVCLISTGTQTSRVHEAATLLAGRGVDTSVLHVPTVKPLDAEAIVAVARASSLIVTCEEHTVIGGLGGCVAEVLASAGGAPPLVRLGITDVFGESGSDADLLDKYGLSASRVADAILCALDVAGHAARLGSRPAIT
jgi:transketolase